MYYGRSKIRLATLGNVRTEMAKCYRSAVARELAWPDFAKAIYGLSLIARLDEGPILEQRIAELERMQLPEKRPNGEARPWR
jgi:hypothetical protein